MKQTLFVILFLINSAFFPQVNIHKIFTTSDGLIQNQINTIYQDSFGYLWLATLGGVSRWDGVNFENYTVNNGLASSIVMDIIEGNDSTIYFATYGSGITTYKNGRFDTISTKDGLISNFVTSFKKNRNDLYFISGGNIIKMQNDKFIALSTNRNIPTQDINDFIVKNDDDIIFGTISNGLFIYSNNSPKHFTIKDGLNSNFITKILYDDKNNLIIGTDKGPNKIIDGKIVDLKFNGKKISSAIHNLYLTQKGDVIYTTSEGVYLENNGEIRLLNMKNGLPTDIVWSATEDKDGNLYFGTNNGGFCIYENDKITKYNLSDETKIRGLTISKSGDLILNSTNDVFYFNKSVIFKTLLDFSPRVIKSMTEMSDGSLFLNTENGTIIYQNGIKSHILKNNTIPPNEIFDAVEGANSIKYLASPSGVIVLDGNKISRITKSDGIVGSYVNSLFFTSDSTLLIGSHGEGFSAYKNGQIKNYGKDSGLSDFTIQCFVELSDKSICIGTTNGGVNFLKNNKFFSITTDNGLLSNNIIGLAVDNSGKIFAASTNGVNIIDLENNSIFIRSLTEEDGLISNECIDNGIKVDRNNDVWIATKSGLSKYNQQGDNQTTIPTQTHIIGFEIFNKPQNLKKFKLNPKLNFDQNYLKFSYVGINLSAPHKIIYQYKLTGVNKDWVTSQEHNVQYTSLDDGKYTFEVKARNEWGYWSEPASLAFVINPAWWETWWFYTLSVLAIGTLIAFVSSYRYRHLLAIEKMRSKISTDLHDSIGSGLSEISILTELLGFKIPEEKSDLKSGLKNVSAISRTLIESMSDIVWLVNPKKDSLKDLFKRLQLSYHEVLKHADVDLLVENLDTLETIKLPMNFRQHLFLIFKEAINNALKYSNADLLNLKIETNGNLLTVTLSDNGIGFDLSDEKMGNGLLNMKNRAKEIGGNIEYFSEKNIGTTIKFTGRFKKRRSNFI